MQRNYRVCAIPTGPAMFGKWGAPEARVGRPLPREVIRAGVWTPFAPRPAVELFCRLDAGARAQFTIVTGRTPTGPWDAALWENGDHAIVFDTPGETVRVVDLSFRGTGPFRFYAVAVNVVGNGEAGASYLVTSEQAAEPAAMNDTAAIIAA